MPTTQKPGSSTGRRAGPATTRERIARAALRVLDKEGAEAVCMRRIAGMM